MDFFLCCCLLETCPYIAMPGIQTPFPSMTSQNKPRIRLSCPAMPCQELGSCLDYLGNNCRRRTLTHFCVRLRHAALCKFCHCHCRCLYRCFVYFWRSWHESWLNAIAMRYDTKTCTCFHFYARCFVSVQFFWLQLDKLLNCSCKFPMTEFYSCLLSLARWRIFLV